MYCCFSKSIRLAALCGLLCAAGCGTHRGVYHTVRPGDTIYRIALTYEVPQDTLMNWNGISDAENLRAGDQLFVPGVSRVRQVVRPRWGGSEAREPQPTWAQRSTPKAEPQREANLRPVPTQRSNPPIRLRMPVQGTVVSGFGFRGGIHHDGLDIAAPEGTPIMAAADGRVLYAGDKLSGYGNLLIIRHSGTYSTVYAHNSELLAQVGDFVTSGQVIAKVGQTGRATGPHLHFEVRNGKKAVDPSGFLP